MTQNNERTHPVREARKILTLALILALIAALCFGIGFLTGGKSKGGTPKLSAVVVQHQLEQVSQLATARYSYTNMGQFEQSSDFYGMKIPFSSKRFIVSYDGSILAGVDLKQAEVKVTGKKVTVTLPAAEILSHEIDEKSLKVFDETKNIFNPLTIENYNNFYADQKSEMEAKASQNGLFAQAEEQAELVVKQVLGPIAEQNDMELAVKLSDRTSEEAASQQNSAE